MRTMSYGIDLGFLKGAKLMDDNNRLTGNGKSIRVLPQKEKLEPELVKYYIDQTIKIIEGVS